MCISTANEPEEFLIKHSLDNNNYNDTMYIPTLARLSNLYLKLDNKYSQSEIRYKTRFAGATYSAKTQDPMPPKQH